ncbi:MAG TPA: TraR/DksA C4-type zinc finger protein [Candidatus Binataceae bacterium]|nr:TraR/DksA C4-type zinc finger protein [Candidatus Binataceae bacterium]
MGRKVDLEGSRREQELRNLLTRLRAHEVGRLKTSRRDAEDDLVTEPGDDMDTARADEDRELHESLVSRSEDRLNAIEAAFVRLDEGRYGVCEACGGEIALKRLEAVPFAVRCTECAASQEESRAAGNLDKHALRHWSAPEEMSEPIDRDDTLEMVAAAIGSGERFAAPSARSSARAARTEPEKKKGKPACKR